MTKTNKNIKTEKLKLKKLLQTHKDKLSKLVYPKRKTTNNNKFNIAIKRLKSKFIKLNKQTFRKIAKRENRRLYYSKKSRFNQKKYVKLMTIKFRLQLLTKQASNPRRIRKINKGVKYASHRAYWKTRRNDVIPFTTKGLRRYKKKKALSRMGSSLYIRAIKRWTNLSEQRAKVFLSKFDTNISGQLNNRYHFYDVLSTYKASYYGVFGKGTHFDERSTKLKLNFVQKKKYRRLKLLRTKLLSKLPKTVFRTPGRYTKPYANLTPKQRWLTNKYVWLKIKSAKRKGFDIDFFKTILGTQFLIAHQTSRNALMRGGRYRNEIIPRVLKGLQYFTLTGRNWARKFQGDQKRAWYYTNLVYPKKLPYYFQSSSVTKSFPYNKFKENWRKRARYPWLHSLVSKRLLYSGFLTSERRELKWLQKFSWIPLLRNKLAIFEKKNKLYFHRKRLLYRGDNREVIRTNKKARIKQILLKSTLPFYGHLRQKQFNRIKEKARSKKSQALSREDIQLGYLERRLDVVVYRLNLAPNIFWARKLILDGSIFVSPSNINQNKEFEKMYAYYKQNAYPLKLRDPQNLYRKTPWNNSFSKDFKSPIYTKLKFLLEPLRNINHLTSPGDVILCAPGALNGQYKSNKVLWQKPIPTHLLSYSNLTETKTKLKSRSNELDSFARKEQTTTNAGVVIFYPTFADLHKKDRIQRSFLRWMSL